MKTTITLISLACSLLSITSAQKLPNIVLIYADDLGYGDVSCYGATKIQTPNIDKLAAEGRKFTDAHSPSAVCTPSRYGLLTGEYPFRADIWGPSGITRELLIQPSRTTIASLLKQAGYDTSIFGKWHLGFTNGVNDFSKPLRPGPNDLGFDYYFGVPIVNSAPPYVFVENDKIVGETADDPIKYVGTKAKNTTPITPLTPKIHGGRTPNRFSGAKAAHALYNDFELSTTLTEHAVKWISERDEDPFFLYFPTTNIHHPFTPAEQFQGTSQLGLYGDFTHELDWTVGEIVKALEEKGVADNTIIIFTSDNGGMANYNGQEALQSGHQINGELLGFKFGVWEGGHRVPFIVKWPGQVPAGTSSDQLISSIDMLATFAAITGQELENTADSVNILSTFTENHETPVRAELLLHPSKRSHLSLREGKWVYIPAQGSGGFSRGPGSHGAGGPVMATFAGKVNSDIVDGKLKDNAPAAQLYDLEADLGQTTNLHDQHPDIVSKMQAKLKALTGK